jgi:hypothetical protein
VADDSEQEAKFLKSSRNRKTENAGLVVLLRDSRHQVIPVDLKRNLLVEIGAPGAPHQAFDAVRTDEPTDPITPLNLRQLAPSIRLVEMKTTRKPIQDTRLQGFFFGVTESELNLAARLGDRYLFAFIVLNTDNRYGREFYTLLTVDQLNERIHSKRTQFQVTLARGTREVSAPYGSGPDILIEL